MTEQTKKSLTKGDIRSTYWRSTFLLGSFNFERMQAMGFCVSMIPAMQANTFNGVLTLKKNNSKGTKSAEVFINKIAIEIGKYLMA